LVFAKSFLVFLLPYNIIIFLGDNSIDLFDDVSQQKNVNLPSNFKKEND